MHPEILKEELDHREFLARNQKYILERCQEYTDILRPQLAELSEETLNKLQPQYIFIALHKYRYSSVPCSGAAEARKNFTLYQDLISSFGELKLLLKYIYWQVKDFFSMYYLVDWLDRVYPSFLTLALANFDYTSHRYDQEILLAYTQRLLYILFPKGVCPDKPGGWPILEDRQKHRDMFFNILSLIQGEDYSRNLREEFDYKYNFLRQIERRLVAQSKLRNALEGFNYTDLDQEIKGY